MTERKYTPEGLPVVSKEINEVVRRDYFSRIKSGAEVYEYIIGKIGDITAENPNVGRLIYSSLESMKELYDGEEFSCGEDVGLRTTFWLVTLYDLLKKQSETNKLEQDFNLS